MNQATINFINQSILDQASKLRYIVKDEAPSSEVDLFSSTSLVVWSGASEATIYQDASVNYAFRAIHDALHLKTGLGFSVSHEVEMGRIQASKQTSDLMADLVYCEVAGQALHYLKTGLFVLDQVAFTNAWLSKLGYK